MFCARARQYGWRGDAALARAWGDSAAREFALQAPTSVGRESIIYAYFAYVAARTALLMGDRECAFAWLSEARRAHYFASPAWLRVDPTWAPLRTDPRFAAFVAERPVTR